MAVPDFQTLMRPILVQLEDGQPRAIGDVRAALAREFNLSDEDLAEELPSGRAKTFNNRVGWATTYLYRCGLLTRPKRSVYRLTDRGRQVLADNPERVDVTVLSQFQELEEFLSTRKLGEEQRTGSPAQQSFTADAAVITPEELIDRAYREMRSALAAELLDQVGGQGPDFFETLVLDVLQAMGYGGSRHDAAQRLGASGDGGVDGVIREDRLGLDQIYIQAKHWAAPVGRPEIQKFFGALHGQRATKGVFITTSTFSREARDYANDVTPRVILIDGRELADLMIDFGVGVTPRQIYTLARIDIDYFETDGGSS
ncbi:MAG TPA: restriction endonuclease [Solirubrobacteraceae bacterium]|nr:restriction endonuclease [Solirubrobacteraceae bacterium]